MKFSVEMMISGYLILHKVSKISLANRKWFVFYRVYYFF